MAGKKEKKVIDVAGPADAKVDIGSKPMIVGHKSLATDPMVREQEDAKVNETEKVEKTDTAEEKTDTAPEVDATTNTETSPETPFETKLEPPSAKQKTIAPITDMSKEAEETPEENKEPELKEAEIPEKPVTDSEEKKETPTDEKDEPKKGTEIDPAAVAMEKEEELRKIVENKKYHVNIKQARGSIKSLLWVLIVLLFAGLISLFVLIDTGKLDLGFNLPFSIFGKTENELPKQQLDASVQTNEQQKEKSIPELSPGFTRFMQDEIGFSFDFPDSWGQLDIRDNNGIRSTDLFLVDIYDRQGETKSSLSVEVRGQSENVDITNSDSRYAKGFIREGELYFEKAAPGKTNAIEAENILAKFDTSLGEVIVVRDTAGIGDGPSLKIYVNLPEGNIMDGLTLTLINSGAGEIGTNRYTDADLENIKLVAQSFTKV